MALSFRHVHVADVYLLYRHTALDERKHVFRCFGHDEDLLARARLANDVDGLLQEKKRVATPVGAAIFMRFWRMVLVDTSSLATRMRLEPRVEFHWVAT